MSEINGSNMKREPTRAKALSQQGVWTGMVCAVATGVVALIAPSTHAAGNGTWLNTGSTSANWTESTNWLNNTVPGSTIGTTNTDVATLNTALGTFGTAGSPVLIDSSTENIGGITFDAAAGKFFIGSTAGNSLFVSSGGAIQVTNTLTNAAGAGNVVTETINAPLVIAGASGAYSLINNSANGTLAKAGILNVGGAISGGNAGATVLTLRGSNTNANTISGVISTGAATTFALTKTEAGTWILSGANTYSGVTTIRGGTLTIGNGGSLNGTTGTALTINGSGTFNVQESGGSTQGMGLLTLTSGDATIQSTFASTSATLTFSNVTARAANGGSANFVISGGTPTTNVIVLSQYNGSAPSTGSLLDKGLFFGGSNYATYDSGGYLRAYATTDTNAVTSPAAATLGVNDATKNAFVTGAITAQTTASVNTINLSSNNLTMSTTAQVLSTNGLISSGSTAATLGSTGGILQATASGGELLVRVNGSSDVLTVTSVIQNFAGGVTGSSLTKVGAGKLVIGGANTYTGGTFVYGGTLQLAGSASNYLADTSTLTIDGGTFDENTSAETVGAVVLISGTINTGSSQLKAPSYDLRSGLVSGRLLDSTAPAAVTKSTEGTVTFSGAFSNLYTGGTTISGGELDLAKTAGVQAASNTTITAGTLKLINSNQILDAATITVNGATASFDLNGKVETVTTVVLDGGGRITGGTLTSSGGSFDLRSGSVSSVLDGSGIALNKTTSGTVTLSNTNTYTGATTIQAGTLALSAVSTNNIATSSTIVVGDSLAHNTAGLDVTGLTNSKIVLGANQTLAGFGTVTGNVTGVSSSTVAPGNSNGKLTVTGNFDLGGGRLGIQLDKSTAGVITLPTSQTISGVAQYDELAVTGMTNVAGGKLVLEVGQNLANGDVYYILDNQGSGTAAANGQFYTATINGLTAQIGGIDAGAGNPLTNGATFSAGGFSFLINYDATVSGTANDISLTAVAVPEPASLGLLSFTGIGLLARRRRRLR
jgi:autotransporter-associated beta strand protein